MTQIDSPFIYKYYREVVLTKSNSSKFFNIKVNANIYCLKEFENSHKCDGDYL